MALCREGAAWRRALLDAWHLVASAAVAGPIAMGSFWCGCEAYAIWGCNRRREAEIRHDAADCIAEIERYLAAVAEPRRREPPF
jgi:hypothetical protein